MFLSLKIDSSQCSAGKLLGDLSHPFGAHVQGDRSTDEVERFLASVRFESRGKVEELVTEIGITPVKQSR